MYSCYSNQCLNFRNHGFLHYFIVLILTLTWNWIIMLPRLWLNLFSCRTFPHTFFFLGIFLLLTSVAFSINQYLLNWGWSYSLLPPIFENFFPLLNIFSHCLYNLQGFSWTSLLKWTEIYESSVYLPSTYKPQLTTEMLIMMDATIKWESWFFLKLLSWIFIDRIFHFE